MTKLKRILNLPLHPFFSPDMQSSSCWELTCTRSLPPVRYAPCCSACWAPPFYCWCGGWSRVVGRGHRFWRPFAFFAYGHIFNLLNGATLGGFIVGRHRVLAPLWGGLCLAGLFLIWKYSAHPQAQAWVPVLNLILLGLTVAVGDDQRVTI
jgi:hypothetical protein